MKRQLIIAVAGAALFVPVTPAAFAGGYHDRDHYHLREKRFVVNFHLDGSRKVHASSHRDAHRLEAFFRSVGAEAHVDGDHIVHYHLHGSRRLVRYSDSEAHRLTEDLKRHGFHARVDHE